ncbi:hypothetical protein Q7P37_002352 [Cladosporium fusiforme]
MNAIITAFGVLSILRVSYKTASALWIQFLRPSKLLKYRHATDSSWALVTGSSDGIGLELARELLANGFNVFVHGRNEKKLQGVKESLLAQFPERSVELIVADAADPNVDYAAIAKQVEAVPGSLAVLINCVGGIITNPIYVPLDQLPGANIDTHIAMNARFPTRLTSVLLPMLKKNSPSLIINAGSFAGVFGMPYIATYTATKAYIHTFTLALRAEMEIEGVRDVEVMGSLIGDTTSSRNTTSDNGMKVPANDCAKGMLAKVGCGETLVAPDWRHWITSLVIFWLPEGVGRRLIAPEMRRRREEEMKGM